MDTLLLTTNEVMCSSCSGLSGLSVLGAVEGSCGRLELGVGLVGFFKNLLGFNTGQTLLSCELKGFETRMGGACLHLFITDS